MTKRKFIGADDEMLGNPMADDGPQVADEARYFPIQPVSTFIDLSGADDAGELIPAGTEAVVYCTKADVKMTRNDDFMIACSFRVSAVALGDPDLVGRMVWDNILFIPPRDGKRGTLWRAKKMLAALGVEWNNAALSREDFAAWVAQTAQDVLGNDMYIIIGVDQGSGQINPNTGEVYPPKNTIKDMRPYVRPAQVTDPFGSVDDDHFDSDADDETTASTNLPF